MDNINYAFQYSDKEGSKDYKRKEQRGRDFERNLYMKKKTK